MSATIALALWAASGSAQFAIDGGSILLFPHVEATEDWDTLIQIINTSVSPTYAECHYVGEGDVDSRGGFDIELVADQPTHWIASRGRPSDDLDEPCMLGQGTDSHRCDGAGFDPGEIPPLATDFRGYLMCVQVDRSGAPESGNSLAGTATLRRSGPVDVAKYDAVTILGNADNDADDTLCLGGDIDETCTRGAEYESCPRTSLLTLPADGGSGTVIEEGTDARPAITVAPCGVDLDSPASQHVLQLIAYSELGQTFSASTQVVGWQHARLSDVNPILNADVIGSEIAALRLRPANGSPPVFVLGQLQTSDDGGASFSTSFIGTHVQGESESLIVLDASGEAVQ